MDVGTGISAKDSLVAGTKNIPVSSGKTNSEYNSVTDQSGIYAVKGGFGIMDKLVD